jgi:hypothetical protein
MHSRLAVEYGARGPITMSGAPGLSTRTAGDGQGSRELKLSHGL